MKTLEFIYQETEIHFLLNPEDENVMVNATEMAKAFNRKTKFYLETDSTKNLIKSFESGIFDGEKEIIRAVKTDQLIQNRGRNGIYFHRELAIDFAMWLDPIFKRWIINKIDEVIFGNLKKYRDAMAEEVKLKSLKSTLKQSLIENPTHESVKAYFDNEDALKSLDTKKRQATRNQLNLFKDLYKNE